ncbi:MAG TPA: glycosyltransferase [Candidatus Eisenbacteria bacterium]|nr:glycosyltransferase [Candidatus Eisenbacteria bacterium]
MLGRWLPPPRRPVRETREYRFAHYLARSHRLTLAFIADNPDAAGSISTLRSEFGDLEFASIPRGWKSLASAVRLVGGESCTLSYFRSEALSTRIADRLRRATYDLLFVSSSSMIQYALAADPSIPLVVDFGRIDSEWWVSQARSMAFPAARFFRSEAARLRSAEAAAARRAVRCATETAEAAEIVQSLGTGSVVTVIPNGLDVGGLNALPLVGDGPTVVFNASLGGALQLRDAFEFYGTIMPAVRGAFPRARFIVASREPIPGVERTDERVGIEVVTSATKVRRLFHGQAVAVAPVRAGFDLRSSVLEPMAAGIPVITTSAVCDRLGARPDRDALVADTAFDASTHLIALLGSTARREELGRRGQAFVQATFGWETRATSLERLLVGGVTKGQEASPLVTPTIPAALGG